MAFYLREIKQPPSSSGHVLLICFILIKYLFKLECNYHILCSSYKVYITVIIVELLFH